MKKAFTIWLTGFSGAGKTTLATQLQNQLLERSVPCEVLDGDVVRQNLSRGLTFSKEDRCLNILRIGFVAELLTRNGICVIVSAISPYRSARDEVRGKINHFVEVFVQCSIEECERRDVKGLYKKARSGELKNFTGIDDPYEEPISPEVVCDTESETVGQSVNNILTVLEKLNYIQRHAHSINQ